MNPTQSASPTTESKALSPGQEIVIFVRTFDFLAWLVAASNHFPRSHRHTVTQRLLNAAFDLRERLEVANLRSGRARLEQLQRADEALACCKMYLRLAFHLKWLTDGQYWHVAKMLVEIGKLLGGWHKATAATG